MYKFWIVVIITFSLIFSTVSFVFAEADYSVAGPATVEVGQLAHFKLLDSAGQPVFMADEDCPLGDVLIAGHPLDDFAFIDDKDGNAQTVSVRFEEPGVYTLFF